MVNDYIENPKKPKRNLKQKPKKKNERNGIKSNKRRQMHQNKKLMRDYCQERNLLELASRVLIFVLFFGLYTAE
jgi:hypothetical protein